MTPRTTNASLTISLHMTNFLKRASAFSRAFAQVAWKQMFF
jgi:hypothetical protein